MFLFRPVDRALGSIPILGNLLLGKADNLVAAYFELDGPWDRPKADAKLLRTFSMGPMRLVTGVMTGIPNVMLRGLETLGGVIRPPGSDGSVSPPPAPAPPAGDGLQP